MANPDLIAICPYYRRESKNSITCEGICQCDTVYSSVKFDFETDKRCWVERYCATFKYKNCPYARMIEQEKYDPT